MTRVPRAPASIKPSPTMNPDDTAAAPHPAFPANISLITFDCYGTLVDWRAGIANAFRTLGETDPNRLEQLTAAYVRTEAEVEAGPYRLYREILRETLARLTFSPAHHFPAESAPNEPRLPFPPTNADFLAESLPDWPVFPDTVAALHRLKSKYRLGILSNIDRDLFAGTARHLEVDFDLVVTAEEVRSYKPADPHVTALFKRPGVDPKTTLHVAQSLFHDGQLAARHGIPFVWINRYIQPEIEVEAPRLATFPTLAALADALNA